MKEIVEALEVVVTCSLGVCRTNGGEVPYQKNPPLLLAALHAQVGQGAFSFSSSYTIIGTHCSLFSFLLQLTALRSTSTQFS
jgi:hypothetical protein